MSEEEKGFIIKDRRSFDEDGELKEDVEQEAVKDKKADTKETTTKKANQETVLPEVNFNSLIFSLSSSALFHLGEIAAPESGEKKKDLPLAKHSIDIIAMLKDKTKGNLDEEENKFIENILSDLRWRYVRAKKEG